MSDKIIVNPQGEKAVSAHLPLPEDEWKLKVNAQYLEVMKVLMNLAIASLVLPTVLVKTFVAPDSSRSLASFLKPWAYLYWGLLLLSLLGGMLFYWTSAKFVKVVCGGTGEYFSENTFERARDSSAAVALLSFLLGLVCLVRFFWTL